MNVLHKLSPAEISTHFSVDTLARARGYADPESVSQVNIQTLTNDRITVLCQVLGTQRAPYVVHLTATLRGPLLSLTTTCTCPVHTQCKHGAALALVLGASFATPAPQRTWESDLSDLLVDLAELAPPERELPGVALQFSWDLPPTRTHSYSRVPQIRVRPMRPGARQPWVKTGLGWQDVPLAVGQRRFDPDQLDVLAELNETLSSQYWYAGFDPSLGDFGSMALPLLRRARDAGITFLTTKPLASVRLIDEPLDLVADATTRDGEVHLVVGLPHEGRLWRGDEVTTWGDPAHTVALHRDGAVDLGTFVRRLPHGPAQALRDGRPVVVPAERTGDLPARLRQLMRLVPIESSDGSVAVPAPVVPGLRLTVAWRSAQEATLTWQWRYDATLVGLDRPHPDRDRAAERVVLARLPQPVGPESRLITGVDVLHLALLELPAWRECPDVEVVEVDAPDFREAAEGPVIAFDVVEPDETRDHTDWLDLEVTVTVEGERVLLADVLAALTLGEAHLVLPSGLFVRTDRPEFARLHDVVQAAAELRERDGDRMSVGRHDLGLWAQLAELGVVDAQADEWVRRAQALRDLVDIPRPDPTGVVSTLRGYQLDGFHWLAFLWQHGLGGILADDMGLGKTLQVLSLVAHTRASTDLPFLVVAPTSVVSAWVTEAQRHTPGLRVRAITASHKRRGESIADLAADADVVVTSYTLQRLEADAYAAVGWAGLVLDEAHQVKNHRSQAYASVRQVDAPFRLAVTGTPFENRLLELWALLSIAAPGLYPHPRSFVDHVVGPVEKRGDADALRRFTARIKPFVLRRTKELVAADLPPKQEQVVQVDLNPRHRKLYDTHLAKERQRILGLVDDFDHNRVAILAALTKLRQLALDPALVDPDDDRVGSAKIDVLVDRLAEVTAEGHRALVFSTFTGFLGRVRDLLTAEGITTAYLDGGTRRRGEVIEGFRSGTASVFLISLKAGGVGLTLTEADYVFVLDPWWNPAAEAQAVDRAHRIGQDKTVMVYRLVSTDTIEDKVMALKERKAALFARVIDGDGTTSQSITADDIRALFD